MNSLEYKKTKIIKAHDNLFCQMLNATALELSQPFLLEEQSVIHALLNYDLSISFKNCNLIIIGGATFPYLDLLIRYFNKYIVIDPFIQTDILINKPITERNKIVLVNKYFDGNEDILLRKENNVLFFWFNVAYHIPELSHILKRATKSGDLVLISGWADTFSSRKLFKEYYTNINQPNQNFLSCSQITKDFDQTKLVHDFEGQFNQTRIFLL